ncbi:iron ABC transporter permease [Paroceanicella profunda]|uniref:Iron ABC transporter permease n=1 Tax=Paroceanicella profunda TaxID=2579971 RepID=A0A5B8FXG7_9RHOB|nr:iron ABC transporter permease [Paroceanicella profunda]QDL91192.1 iron ABC transporter permease [Paroceanicella profunda]
MSGAPGAGGVLPRRGPVPRPGLMLALAGGLVALAVTLLSLGQDLAPADWLSAALAPPADRPDMLVFHYAVLPRVTVALIGGAMLGLAGVLLQQALENPLAAPGTLGVDAGAGLVMSIVLLALPDAGRGTLLAGALAGGFASFALVRLMAGGERASPLRLILAGLVVALFCASAAAALRIFNQEYLQAMFLWGAGSLTQDGWGDTLFLLPALALGGVLSALLVRPLGLLALGGQAARAAGLNAGTWRWGACAAAILLSATASAAIGSMGFVALAAPHVARLAGARRLGPRLCGAAAAGGGLLLVVDQVTRQLPGDPPAGALTALIGAPLLLWLALRNRPRALPPRGEAQPRAARPVARIAGVGAAALVVAVGACLVARGPEGWTFGFVPETWPRMALAVLAGGMVAAAGALLQRLLRNPLATPEMTGIGPGVTLGLIAAFLLSPTAGPALKIGCMVAGALAVLAVLMRIGARTRFAPETVLLAGVLLTFLLDGLTSLFLAFGDPRSIELMLWVAGSTWGARPEQALWLGLAALVLLAPLALVTRWLDLLSLGAEAAQATGLRLGLARAVLLLLAAGLSVAATFAIGPYSFVGLIGPQVALRLGLVRAAEHLAGAVCVGALAMGVAQGLGAWVAFPYDLPAGLTAALVCLPYLAFRLRR